MLPLENDGRFLRQLSIKGEASDGGPIPDLSVLSFVQTGRSGA